MIPTLREDNARMGWALGLAAALHAAFILGVQFAGPDGGGEAPTPTLDVILSTADLETAPPDDAEYLGMTDQRGGGNTAEQVRSVLPDPVSTQTEEDEEAERERASGSEDLDLVASRAEAADSAVLDLRPHAVGAAGTRRVVALAPLVRSRDLRERVLSANTRHTLFAEYLAAWTDKIERLGTLNFPDEARRTGMEGNPVLEVAIRADGSVAEVKVRESSGEPALDEAAERILRLASPFEPFPADLRDHYDTLRFAYEWRFLSGGRVATRLRSIEGERP